MLYITRSTTICLYEYNRLLQSNLIHSHSLIQRYLMHKAYNSIFSRCRLKKIGNMWRWSWIDYFCGYSRWRCWPAQLALYYKRQHYTMIGCQSIENVRSTHQRQRSNDVQSNSNTRFIQFTFYW